MGNSCSGECKSEHEREITSRASWYYGVHLKFMDMKFRRPVSTVCFFVLQWGRNSGCY